MGKVINIRSAAKTDREIIERSLAEIRGCGWLVDIVKDNGSSLIVDAFDGEGACYRMLIDPAQNEG